MLAEGGKIQWISTRKTSGDEWKGFTKSFCVDKRIKRAVFRLQSDAICGVYVNDEFITSGTGHYAERVTAHEITSRLNMGKNTVRLMLGARYFPWGGEEAKYLRGFWYSNLAFELEIEYEDGSCAYLPTDDTWESDGGKEVIEYMTVTDEEYKMQWLHCAVWDEVNEEHKINDAVLKVVGEEFEEYSRNSRVPEYIRPVAIAETNMTHDELQIEGLDFTPLERAAGEKRYVTFDFGRLTIGFAWFELAVGAKMKIEQLVEYAETVDELNGDYMSRGVIKNLRSFVDVSPEDKTVMNLQRRGSRYYRIIFSDTSADIRLTDFAIRTCMYPVKKTGYFKSNDTLLNDIWEVGKYTLHVNKQQEYESCPRQEAKFFSGDGIITALVDYYAFGESGDLLDASLSIRGQNGCGGRVVDILSQCGVSLLGYPGWRIISIYNDYVYNKNLDFIKFHYEDCVKAAEWYVSRLNKRGLIFTPQIFALPFQVSLGGVALDYSGSPVRVGEKTYLNAVAYKTLLCMAEMSRILGDGRAEEWENEAERIKNGINTYLWSEEKKAYIDAEYDYIPQDGNALAVLFGIADKERGKAAFETVKETLWSEFGSALLSKPTHIAFAMGGGNTISPMMCTHEAEASFKMGYGDRALDLIRRCWGSMLKKGATTFWEYAHNNAEGQWRARCHGWSSGCTYLLSAYVLGITPSKYGWEKVTFDPICGDLTDFVGVVPTYLGDIAIKMVTVDGEKKYTLALPMGIELETRISRKDLEVIRY